MLLDSRCCFLEKLQVQLVKSVEAPASAPPLKSVSKVANCSYYFLAPEVAAWLTHLKSSPVSNAAVTAR